MSRMTRSQFLRLAGLASVGVAVGRPFVMAARRIKEVSEGKKPNIVFVFADQLRYSALGCSGNPQVYTPNFDRLASEGLLFEQAFSSCPICSPYRGQLMTGRYSHKNGVVDNEYRLRKDQTTFPQALKPEGYRTAYIGKWHLGKGPYTEEKRHGFDYMYACNINHNHYTVRLWENEKGPFFKRTWAPGFETTKALEFIDRHVQEHETAPFALFLSWGPPHNDQVNPPRNLQSVDSRTRPYYQYPGEFAIYDTAKIELQPNVPFPFADQARHEIADYYGKVSSLDYQMGRIMEHLEKLGIDENTILCFSSDHGDHLRSHGYGGPNETFLHPTKRSNKATPHDEACHIPFLMKYPARIKKGDRTRVFFSSVDVMPTILGLCDVPVPQGVQGKDLSKQIQRLGGEEPDSVFLQILGPGWPNTDHRGKWIGLWRGVRNDRWVYARWKNTDQGRWLFDRENDPFELNNLAGNPKYAAIEEKMEKRLQQWLRETDDPFDTGARDPKTDMLQLGQQLQEDWGN